MVDSCFFAMLLTIVGVSALFGVGINLVCLNKCCGGLYVDLNARIVVFN